MTQRPIVWSIAGSDSGGGAGLQADLKAFEAMDVHGCTAVAAITAQNSVAVQRAEAVATDLLDAQLTALAGDLRPAAIKTGMLGSVSNALCVASWLDRLRSDAPVALVVDPIRRATTGASLSSEALRQALLHELLPRATVITPNRVEAAWLLGLPSAEVNGSAANLREAAAALRALGAQAVVITGGDAGGEQASDWLSTPQAEGWLTLPRIVTDHHHGSGCVFASSLAAALSRGFCAADAAVIAKMSAAQALAHAAPAGAGAGAVRPQRGFGLHAECLPTLWDPAWGDADAGASNYGGYLPETQRLGLYAIVDSADAVAEMIRIGVRTLQLRIKDPQQPGLAAEVRRAIDVARNAGARLYINDYWEMALEYRAYGVHLGQEDLMTANLPALRASGMRVGISTHSYWEVCRAHALQPSYVACGPIFDTPTKEMPWRPQGLDNLAYWCHVLRYPVVAIAGMDELRSREAVRCGAAGIAVLRGVARVDEPARAVTSLMAAMGDGAVAPRLIPPALPRSTFDG